MNRYMSKYKYIVAAILVIVLSAFVIPTEHYGISNEVEESLPFDNIMVFSRADFMCTFYFSEKVNAFKENYFAEHKSKRNINPIDNKTVYTQDFVSKTPFVDYRIAVLPFYVIICVLMIHVVIKYIYNKDGKKRTSYLHTNQILKFMR